jgi:hypothetical protein
MTPTPGHTRFLTLRRVAAEAGRKINRTNTGHYRLPPRPVQHQGPPRLLAFGHRGSPFSHPALGREPDGCPHEGRCGGAVPAVGYAGRRGQDASQRRGQPRVEQSTATRARFTRACPRRRPRWSGGKGGGGKGAMMCPSRKGAGTAGTDSSARACSLLFVLLKRVRVARAGVTSVRECTVLGELPLLLS